MQNLPFAYLIAKHSKSLKKKSKILTITVESVSTFCADECGNRQLMHVMLCFFDFQLNNNSINRDLLYF